MCDCPCRGLGAVVQTEFAKNSLYIILDCALGQPERFSDLPISKTLRQ